MLRLAAHVDDFVRFHVAANIPRLVDPESPDDAAITALEMLTGDADDDVRGYAIYGLVAELEIDPARIACTIARLAADPDPHVRWLASGGASPEAPEMDTAITLDDLVAAASGVEHYWTVRPGTEPG